MPHFRYQAVNAQQQPIAGELEAQSVSQAVGRLEAEGLTVQSIGYATPGTSVGESPFREITAPSDEMGQAELVRHMERVIERGRPLTPALHAYAAEMPAGQSRRQLDGILRIIDSGDAALAAAALQKGPTYWIPLLSAATSSPDPGRILQEFLKESRQAEELRRQWRQTLVYPLVMLCAAAAVMIFLSIVVVPVFRDIFSEFGLKLPWLTMSVVTLASWITSGQILIVIAVLVVLGLFLRWLTGFVPRVIRDFLGDWFGTPLGRWTAIARFYQFLADLLEAELEPAQALLLAGFATGSPRLKRAAWRMAGEMSAGGEVLQQPYERTRTITALHALRSDLPLVSRVRLLREVSRGHAERASVLLSWTRGIIEPLSLLFIGLLVACVVVALFLPLFSLIQGLSF
jgi:type II secretory pathway component PulF